MSTTALLQAHDLETFYGDAQALFGASLSVAEGEFVTLLGRNGMGKTTSVRSVMGIMTPRQGRIVFAGQDITHLPSHQIARLGIGLVPEQRQVFANLTVYENLVATAHNRLNQREPWTLERVYQLFPRLKERAGNLGANLSGGEQQMLAIGRALMTNPRLLILDEATEGLAPLVRAEIWHCLHTLKTSGLSVKNLVPLMRLADTHYILEKGQTIWHGSSDSLMDARHELKDSLGV
ncbi:ABC transporter ATP-binding protein [Limnohabitans sp. JirII-29]|uniref:ABC transporter ATP-binding protein n=1 Tax=Limnohabitans sp. JirII-29 TaxID=1835756 RepID=UPI000D3CE592|nr:ABC transporter ATP-binding protein [Limnohabitans sp. JirII-29]PUE23942.1 ABC transporter ATP-binding protein [Limnohabitans sp. JirII-29]